LYILRYIAIWAEVIRILRMGLSGLKTVLHLSFKQLINWY